MNLIELKKHYNSNLFGRIILILDKFGHYSIGHLQSFNYSDGDMNIHEFKWGESRYWLLP